jgi:hypothetical protein
VHDPLISWRLLAADALSGFADIGHKGTTGDLLEPLPGGWVWDALASVCGSFGCVTLA